MDFIDVQLQRGRRSLEVRVTAEARTLVPQRQDRTVVIEALVVGDHGPLPVRISRRLRTDFVAPPAIDGLPSDDDERTTIRARLAIFESAINVRDGALAAALVAPSTFAQMERQREAADRASADELRALTMLDRATVLLLRHGVPRALRQSFDGPAAFAHFVSEGWAGGPGPVSEELDVEIDGDRATFPAEPLVPDLVRVDGAWCIDWLGWLGRSGALVEQQRRAHGLDEDAFLARALERQLGRAPADLYAPDGD